MKRRVLCLLLALVLVIGALPLPAMAAVNTDFKYYLVELNATSDTYRDSHPVGTYHVMYNDYITLIVFPNGNASTVPTRQYWSYLSQWEARCSNLYTGVTIADTSRLVLNFPMTQRVSFLRNPNLVSKDAKFNSSNKVTSGSYTVMTEQKLDMNYMNIQRNSWGEIEVRTYFEDDGTQAAMTYSITPDYKIEDERNWSVSMFSTVDYKYHWWDAWNQTIKMDGKTMVKNPPLGGARYLEATLPGKKIADIILLKGQLGMDTFAGVNSSGKTLYLLVDANGSIKSTVQIPTKVGSTKLPSAIAGKKLAGTYVDMRMKAQTTMNYSGFTTAMKSALKNAALAASFHWEKEILEHTIAIDVVLNKHVKLSVGVLFDLTDISVTIPLSSASAASSYAAFAATGETDAGEPYALLVSNAEAANSQSSSVTVVPTPGAPKNTSFDVTITDRDMLDNTQLQLTLNGGSYTAEALKSIFTVTDENGSPVELVFAEYDENGDFLNESDSPNAYCSIPVAADFDSYAIDEYGNLILGEAAASDEYAVVLTLPEVGTYTITTNTLSAAALSADTQLPAETAAEPEQIPEETETVPQETKEVIEETEAVPQETAEVTDETEPAPEATEESTEATEAAAYSISLMSVSSEAALTVAEEAAAETEAAPAETEVPAEEPVIETEEPAIEPEVVVEEALQEAAAAAAVPTFTIDAFTYQAQEDIEGQVANLKENTTYVLSLYLVDEEGKAYDYQALSGKDEVLLTSSHNGASVSGLLTLDSNDMNVNYLPTGSFDVVYELAKRGALIGEDGKTVTDENGETIYVDIPVATDETGTTVTNTNPDDLPEVSNLTVADAGNEVLRASWTGAENVDGYYVSVQQLSAGVWTDTGAAYEVRDEDGDGIPDTTIDMAVTVTGVDDNLLLADQSYRVKVHTIRDMTMPGSNEVAARHSDGVFSSSATVKEVTPVSLTYTPTAIVTTDDSGAITGKVLYVIPGQDVIITASSAADITVSTNSANVTVDAAAMSSTSAAFSVPEFDGTLMVRVDAVDETDGDISTEYLSLRRDNIAPLITTDQQVLRIAPGNTTVTITGHTEPGVTLSIEGKEYPVNADGSFTAEITLSEEVMQTDGTISINGGAKPKLDENGEPLIDADGNYLYEDAVITGADNPELADQILGEARTLLVAATDRAGNMGTTTVYVQWGVESGHVHSMSLRYNEDQHWTECSCGETGTKEDHIYDGTDCTVCGYNGQLITLESITLTQDYLAMETGETARLQVSVAPAELASRVRWSVEPGSEGIVFVDSEGTVTALGSGLGYVIATVSDGTTTRTARCRVDVSAPVVVEGIRLGTEKATAELFSTDYALLDVLLLLPQNTPAAADGLHVSRAAAMAGPTDLGIAIDSARFTDAAMAALFDLVPMDDRTLAVVPTDYAMANAKSVKGSYSGTVAVTVDGQEFTTEEVLKLTVKKTQPKLKVTVDAFNSFYTNHSNPIKVTNATITDIQLNPSAAEPLPQWLELKDGALALTDDAPVRNVSGKAYLLVQTEEWRQPIAVTLSVKSSYKVPGLKLSASSVKLSADPLTSEGVSLQLLPKNRKETLSGLGVSDISAPAGYSIRDFDPVTGAFTLRTEAGFQAGKIPLTVSFSSTKETLDLMLTVKTTAVTLKASASSVTLNAVTGDSAAVRLTSAPADYRITAPAFRLLDSNKEETLNSGELSITYQDGAVYIATTSATPGNAKYTLYISAGGSKEVAVKITTVTAQPTLKLKASGKLDLSFPAQTVTLTPTFKNHSADNYTAPVNDLFQIRQDAQGRFLLTRADGGTLDHSLKYQAVLVTTYSTGVTVRSKAVSLKPRMGSVKLVLQAENPLLFVNDKNDRVEFSIMSTDTALNRIKKVTIKGAKYADLFRVYDYGNGQFALGFGDSLPDSKLKTVSLPLEVWLEGNETAKANGTVKLKLTLSR